MCVSISQKNLFVIPLTAIHNVMIINFLSNSMPLKVRVSISKTSSNVYYTQSDRTKKGVLSLDYLALEILQNRGLPYIS